MSPAALVKKIETIAAALSFVHGCCFSAVRKMIEDGRDYADILIQIAAVRSAVNNIGKIILKDHIDHCVVDAIETGDQKVLDDLSEAIDRFVK